jgi:hypothetical protein
LFIDIDSFGRFAWVDNGAHAESKIYSCNECTRLRLICANSRKICQIDVTKDA